MDYYPWIRGIIAKELSMDEKEVVPEAHLLNDLGADSLALVTLAEAISGSKRSAAAGKPKHIENSNWIRKRNSNHVTLQLAALSSEQTAKDLIEKQSQPGTYAYYRIKQKDRSVYVAIYGSFSRRSEAQKAASLFASLKPWLREFGNIQQAMAR